MTTRTGRAIVTAVFVLLIAALPTLAQDVGPVETGTVDVGGLEMYYEIHGDGEPIVVLHGAYMSIRTMGEIIPRLAETRQVIAVELQGHGRTGDIERPLSYEQLADDVAALMAAIGLEQADVFGYSMGGITALQLAVRHPALVDKLIVVSANFDNSGLQPGTIDFIDMMTPEMFVGTPVLDDYAALSPNPDGFAALLAKVGALDKEFPGIPRESVAAIAAPTLVIVGDSDSITLDHAVELFRLRGGGVDGDIAGLPESQLAIIPGATHIGILFRADELNTITTAFLEGAAGGPMF